MNISFNLNKLEPKSKDLLRHSRKPYPVIPAQAGIHNKHEARGNPNDGSSFRRLERTFVLVAVAKRFPPARE